MGWSSGSRLAAELIHAAQDSFSDASERKKFWQLAIEAFEDLDCDTLCECLEIDPAFDEALREAHPNWDIDDSSGE